MSTLTSSAVWSEGLAITANAINPPDDAEAPTFSTASSGAGFGVGVGVGVLRGVAARGA